MLAAVPPPALPPLDLVAPLVAPSASAPHGWTTYRVRAGDTLTAVAARHRTTVGALVARNHLRDPGLIHPGDRLQVPKAAAAAPRSTGTPARTARTVHVVRSGETVSHIAARYGTSVSAVLKANGLRASSIIHPGDRITVRTSAARSTAAAARTTKTASRSATTRTHTVRAGDTLSHVAARYGSSVAAVAKASGISASSVLRIGQRLRVPVSSSTAGTTAHPVSDSFGGVRYPSSTVAAARHNHDVLAARRVPSRSEVKAMVSRTARRHGVDPRLALAVSYQESGWNQRAVSPANAVGVMQVIPAAGDWASSLVGRKLDLLDTQDNITAGVVMLRALGRSTSSTETTVAAYYQGLTSVREHGMYSDTRRYVASIMRLRATM